jgi:hypothetical protein
MANIASGRAYIVTSHGTLERVVQKRMAGSKKDKDDTHDLKIIFPNTSSDSIRHKMMYKGRHKFADPLNSFNLRDHIEAQAKHYPHEDANAYKARSFNMSKWC